MPTKKPRKCEVCRKELQGSDGIAVGHVSTSKTLDLCREHYKEPEVWQPLYDAVFGEHVEKTKAESPVKTKSGRRKP